MDDTTTATDTPPVGLTVLSTEGSIHIRRRWRRPKHFFFVTWVLPLGLWLAKMWVEDGFSVPLLIGSLITASIAVRLIGMFVNHSDIRFDGERVTMTHGPLPSLGMPRVDVDMSEFKALRMGRHGPLHAVEGVDEAGENTPVVRPLATMAQAAFVRDLLASALGIEARGTDLKHAADDRIGAASIGAALLPLLVIGGVVLFGAALTSSAEGSLQLVSAGPDAVIVATQENDLGVRITAAVDSDDSSPGGFTDEPDGGNGQQLEHCLRHHKVPFECRKALLRDLEHIEDDDPQYALASAIEQNFQFEPLTFDKPLMLIGLPGQGKTASCAKLAARFSLEGEAVSAFSCDTARAGGTAQLRQLLAAMQVELHDIVDAAQMKKALAAMTTDGPVLIDSFGFDPFRGEELLQIAEIIAAANAEPVLVTAASSIADDVLEAADNLRAIGVRRAIVTKLDLARRYGVIPAIGHAGIALSEAGFSPMIGSPLKPLDADSVAQLLCQQRSANERVRL